MIKAQEAFDKERLAWQVIMYALSLNSKLSIVMA